MIGILALFVYIVIITYVTHKIKQDSLEREVKQQLKKVEVMIEISRHEDIFYVHDKSTGEFLAQGKTHSEIADVLLARFPGKVFMALPGNLEEVGFNERF